MESMLYCEEAIINCDNYGAAITFELAIYIRREKRDDSRKGKNTKNSKFIMKTSVRVCVTTQKIQ